MKVHTKDLLIAGHGFMSMYQMQRTPSDSKSNKKSSNCRLKNTSVTGVVLHSIIYNLLDFFISHRDIPNQS